MRVTCGMAMKASSFISQIRPGWFHLTVHAKPGARSSSLACHPADTDPALEVRIGAPPVEGKANAELVDFMQLFIEQELAHLRTVTHEMPMESNDVDSAQTYETYTKKDKKKNNKKEMKDIPASYPEKVRVSLVGGSTARHKVLEVAFPGTKDELFLGLEGLMHTFCTIRYPPPSAQKVGDDGRPIRVTEKAVESLLFCIVHTIEFQSPLQPSKPHLGSSVGSCGKEVAVLDDDRYVRPVETTSALLGNVTYVARSKHNPSVLSSLHEAVRAAHAIAIPEKSSQVPMELRVRLLRRNRGWLWHDSRPLVEWVFRMVKTKEEFSHPDACGDGGGRRQRTLQGAAIPPTFAMARAAAAATAGGGGQSRIQEEGFQHANDPVQIRHVLQFILKQSYDAIDLDTYADFRSGELIFDVSVQKAL